MLLQWDRLLETCYRRTSPELFFQPGSPLYIRYEGEWRTLQTPPLEAEDIVAMTEQIFQGKFDGDTSRFAFKSIAYGSFARFRFEAYGYPRTRVLKVFRVPQEENGSPATGVGV